MKIAVVGGRDFNNYNALCLALVEFKPSMIVSGGVNGADALADWNGTSTGTKDSIDKAKALGKKVVVIPY